MISLARCSIPDDALSQALPRFWSYVEKTDGCWLWIGTKRKGYGSFGLTVNGKSSNWLAHRISYWLAYRTLSPILDHLCNNTACVRPDHLKEATAKENTLRGRAPSAENARKQCCKRGHPLTPENLIPCEIPRRKCLKCKQLYEKRRWVRTKASDRVKRHKEWLSRRETIKCPECEELFAKDNPGTLATHMRFRHQPNPPKVGRAARTR